MKHSPKGPTPTHLADWRASDDPDWVPSYAALDGNQRRAILADLSKEQGYVCAYCGRAIGLADRDSHIDHYYCQNLFPDRTVDYANMFASCGPPQQKRLPSTCGDAKKGVPPPDPCLLPSDPSCEARFSYGESGEAVPLDDSATNMGSWLKLNHPALVQERAALIAMIIAMIRSGEISLPDKEEEIRLWRSRNVNGRLRSFGHVAARYLEDAL